MPTNGVLSLPETKAARRCPARPNCNFVPKVKIEVVCTEESLQTIIDTIVAKAQTGQMGDGKIFVSKLEEAIRIRTGEKGSDAI